MSISVTVFLAGRCGLSSASSIHAANSLWDFLLCVTHRTRSARPPPDDRQRLWSTLSEAVRSHRLSVSRRGLRAAAQGLGEALCAVVKRTNRQVDRILGESKSCTVIPPERRADRFERRLHARALGKGLRMKNRSCQYGPCRAQASIQSIRRSFVVRAAPISHDACEVPVRTASSRSRVIGSMTRRQ